MNAENQSQREDQVNDAIANYLEAADSGAAPDAQEFIARHPDIAAELEIFFADRQQFARFVGPLDAASPHGQAPSSTELVAEGTDALAPTLPPSGQPSVTLVGTRVRYFGDYELLEEIARGGMGVVYKARQVTLKRIVALKMILAGQLAGDEDTRRFYAEAEATAKLDHPGIVPIFEVGQHEGQHYFSMAFVDGQSLAHKVSQGVLAPRAAAEITQKVGRAIAYAHVEGVIHRDLKPANVLIDRDGQPRVTDFGLAKRVPKNATESQAVSQLTETGQLLGTPSYMSPEQAAGKTKDIGPLSDVYSLGAILYCLLTGRAPFQAAMPLDTLRQVLEQEPVPPRQLNSSVPRDLETICLKCLEKEPHRRYASAQELVDDLQRFLSGEPIHARPINAAERSWRWLRKQRRSAIVGTTAALAAAALVVASFIGWGLYEQSQLGFLNLKTESTDSSVLVAELFDERDDPAAAAFTVPTKEPVPLVAGAYRLRVSGSGSLSETFLLDVDPGSEQTFTVGLGERKLGDPVRVAALERVEIAELDGGPDFIVQPLEPSKPIFRRISGATGKPVWEVNLTPDAKEAAELLKTPQEQAEWGTFSGWNISVGLGTLRLVKPAPDLNGDGIGDLVWVCPSYVGPTQAPVLVALSGKDGKPLWWARQKKDGDANTRVIGIPLVVQRGGLSFNRKPEPSALPDAPSLPVPLPSSEAREAEGDAVLIAEFNSKKKFWIEAFAGHTGESLWRSDIDPAWIASSAKGEPYELSRCRVSGRDVVVTVAGSTLIGVDAATGQPAWAPHDLNVTAKPIDGAVVSILAGLVEPRVGDVDGDGSDEMLLLEDINMDSSGIDQGVQLKAMSLATRQTLWQTTLTLDEGRLKNGGSNHSWPVIADIDGDGKAEVIVPLDSGLSYQAWEGVEVLDGTTGQRRWARRLPINLQMIGNSNRAANRYQVGPDLDGDGIRELFMISARSDQTERGGDRRHPSQYSLFVDAFSGKDGHTIWSSRNPLGDVLPTMKSSGIGSVIWGPPGPDGRPSLVVPVASTTEYGDKVSRSVFSFCASTGRVLHVAANLWPPVVGDFNRDGITDLCSFVPDNPMNLPYSETLENAAGKLVVFRGTPPEPWRRLGAWEPAADFDGDGQPELFKAGTPECIVASGRDGRITARWRTDWSVPGVYAGHYAGDKFPLALPLGDLNRDGIADVLRCTTHEYFDHSGNRPHVNRPGRLYFPLQAVSGKTGERLWLAQDIPDPVSTNHASLKLASYSPVCDDLDGRGSPDVLCPFSCYQSLGPNPGSGFPRQLGLARFSGSDGTLRWTQMLEDEIALAKGKGGIAMDAFTPPIAITLVDLNADGVRDVLVTVAIREDYGVEVQGLYGRDGKRLWRHSLARKWQANFYPNESPQPLCGDIDGDGRPEVVLLDDLGASAEGWLTYSVTALDGESGEPKWTWKYMDHGNWLRPRIVLADLKGDGVASVCVSLHESEAKSEIVVLSSRGEVERRFEGGTHVVNNFAVDTSAMRIWAGDVDGDGRDEFLYVADGKIRATRGPADETLWEWPLPGSAGGILEIRLGERRGPSGTNKGTAQAGDARSPATIVVEAAGASTIDMWGKSYLESFPPHQGMGTRGDSIYGLDGATGKPVWRGQRDPAGHATISSSPQVGVAPTAGPPRTLTTGEQTLATSLPAIVSRSSDHTIARLILPTNPAGEALPAAVVALVAETSALDPRLLRRLPWAPRMPVTGIRQAIEFLRPPAIMALYSLVVLVIPAWLLRGVLRRQWTLRDLMLVPVAFAVAFVGYQVVMAIPDQKGAIPDGPLVARLLATLPGIPVLAFPTLLVVWTIRCSWSRLAWLLGASLAFSLLILIIAIGIDSRGMDPSEHYSWNGWYLIVIMGSYGATALTLVGMLIGSNLQAIRRSLRRSAQAI